MTSFERTAYPRFGRLVTARELAGLSPAPDEVGWARDRTRSDAHLLALPGLSVLPVEALVAGAGRDGPLDSGRGRITNGSGGGPVRSATWVVRPDYDERGGAAVTAIEKCVRSGHDECGDPSYIRAGWCLPAQSAPTDEGGVAR